MSSFHFTLFRTHGVTQSDIAAVLDSTVRRSVVELLLSDGTGRDFEALAARLASASDGHATARRYATQLHHVHLPKLDDAGLVEWDQEEATVTVSRRARQVVNGPTTPLGEMAEAHGDN